MGWKLTPVLPVLVLLSGIVAGGCSYNATIDAFDTAALVEAEGKDDSLGAMMRVAETARQSGNFAAAANLYRRAHAAAPGRIEPLLHLGSVLVDMGIANDATQAYRAALALNPQDTRALRGLGEAFLVLGRSEMAITQYRTALSLAEEADSYVGLGVALDMNGAHAPAQEVYLRAMDLEPDNPVLRNNLALSLAFDGRFDEAISYLSVLVDSALATVQHRQNLALVYGLAGRMREAARIARMDLDEESVQKNLAYYELLSGLDRGVLKAGAVGIQRERGNPYMMQSVTSAP